MSTTIHSILCDHLVATLKMFSNVVNACPAELWDQGGGNRPIWQHAYHTLVGLDMFLRDDGAGYEFPPFGSEAAGRLQADAGSPVPREQMITYMEQVYARCTRWLESIDDPALLAEGTFFDQRSTVLARILMSIRHTMHHVGAMHAILRRQTNTAPEWIEPGM